MRPARVADSGGIVAVVREVYDEHGFVWEPEGYHADLHDVIGRYWARGGGFWVAEDGDGRIVGTVGLRSGGVSIAGCDGSVERLYVLAAARGSGLGAALVGTAVDAAREHGWRALEIWSDRRLEASHRLYERLGARRAGERIADDPERSAEWGMVLRLGEEPDDPSPFRDEREYGAAAARLQSQTRISDVRSER